jgi:hypothetical protein
MLPVRPHRPPPPLPPIAQIDRSGGRVKDQSSWLKIIGRKIGKQQRIEWSLGHRQMTGLGNERRKLGISDRMLLDRKRLNMLLMNRPFIGIELLRAHTKDSPRQFHQVRECPHEDDANQPLTRSAVRGGLWSTPRAVDITTRGWRGTNDGEFPPAVVMTPRDHSQLSRQQSGFR